LYVLHIVGGNHHAMSAKCVLFQLPFLNSCH
jgi:hypothetical protein